jgi:hypothetical protein
MKATNYFKVHISETSRNSTKDSPDLFNVINETFETLAECELYITDRYGKMPSKRNKVYRDTKDGKSEIIGFLHSYWNTDWSHNAAKWLQTDWITITKVSEEPVLI